jgi:predicted NAD/FAD-binding protein
MPFEQPRLMPRRVAVIGGGISGMAAAYMAAQDHDVVLFEAGARLGGHARTVIAGKRGDQPVDTGFIVFNRENYPHLTALFEELEVPVIPSNMGFCASIGGGRVEYGLDTLNMIFAQRRNLIKPSYIRMLRDILHFNAKAADVVTPDMSIRDLLAALGTSDAFRDHYLTPFSGAIWSMPVRDILDFPADAMIRFFENHRLLSSKGHHRWMTLKGGSIEYVSRLTGALIERGVKIRCKTAVAAVKRRSDDVLLRCVGAEWESFDEVIFATHADDTLSMLSDASAQEHAALSAVQYQPNEAVLHCDPGAMPKSRRVWSSWAYVEPEGGPGDQIELTYWMNSLQAIPMDDPLFVTLNSTGRIRSEMIYDSVTFRHPVYNSDTLRGQAGIRALNGGRNTWYCGAWMKSGFHEDGFASAVDVIEQMRARAEAAVE